MNQFFKVAQVGLICLLLPSVVVSQQDSSKKLADEKSKIKSLLKTQTDKWNQRDLEGFMATYWKSEKLTFSSRGVTTRGWKATLAKYKKNYQGAGKEMGHLTFDQLQIDLVSENIALVLGNWHLKMKDEANNASGNFSLVLKTFDGHWKIIHDHSSSIQKK